MSDELRLRLNFSSGEVEIGGRSDLVQEWWKLLDQDVAEFRRRFTGRTAQPLPVGAGAAGMNSDKSRRANSLNLPETFGEFLQQFPATISDIERALVAGFFSQARDENNSFATGAVNDLLLQQGIRLTNPSSSIRRNVDARRAIVLGSGQFRVSQAGVEYLGRLQTQPM